MRFTHCFCYQKHGSLLHYHFTLTCLPGGIFSVALSVTKGLYSKTVTSTCCPVITRHFFRRSPDFTSHYISIIRNIMCDYLSCLIIYSSESTSDSSSSSRSSSSSEPISLSSSNSDSLS